MGAKSSKRFACVKEGDNVEHICLIGLLQKEFTKTLAHYKPRVQFPSKVIVKLNGQKFSDETQANRSWVYNCCVSGNSLS